jgi:hypothetical protein
MTPADAGVDGGDASGWFLSYALQDHRFVSDLIIELNCLKKQ